MYIDTDDYAASGIEVLTFPGGEPHANVPAWPSTVVHVFAKIRSWKDFGYLCAVGDALYTQGVTVHLFMPYLPGARQDRNPDGLTPLTPRLYTNQLYWASTLMCADPHSIAAAEHYSNGFGGRMFILDTARVVADLTIGHQYDYVLVPDKGAAIRGREVADRLGIKRVIHCEKKRDFETGTLSGFSVPYLRGPGLLVDDICDGGGTFVGILEVVQAQNDSDAVLDLYITHGIFSKGISVLSGFNHVYTTNSFCQAIDCPGVQPRLTVANLIPYYFGGLNP